MQGHLAAHGTHSRGTSGELNTSDDVGRQVRSLLGEIMFLDETYYGVAQFGSRQHQRYLDC